jgi:hypothetical protein
MSMKFPVEADVFGGKFPVCTEAQKARMEEAFQSALAFTNEADEKMSQCSCDLVIELLNPNASRQATIEAAIVIARDIYSKKALGMALTEVSNQMRDSMLNDMLGSMPISGKGN